MCYTVFRGTVVELTAKRAFGLPVNNKNSTCQIARFFFKDIYTAYSHDTFSNLLPLKWVHSYEVREEKKALRCGQVRRVCDLDLSTKHFDEHL